MGNVDTQTMDRPFRRRLIAVAAILVVALPASKATAQTEMLPELRPDRPPLAGPGAPQGAQPAALGPLVILFPTGDNAVSPGYADLLQDVAVRLETVETARVKLRGYAVSTEDARLARRLSLDRVLAVRERLIEGGLSDTRIDLLALGNLAVAGPPDRVDLAVTQ